MQNAIYSIRPYRYQHTWVFDDERVALVKEPFVMGIPEIIDLAVENIPDAEEGFTLLFNDTGLPQPTIVLKKLYEEHGGNWYECTDTGMQGWLCPALFRYYPEAPEKIFIKIQP